MEDYLDRYSYPDTKENLSTAKPFDPTTTTREEPYWWCEGGYSGNEIEKDKSAAVAAGELACIQAYVNMAGYVMKAGALTGGSQYHPHSHHGMGVGSHPHPHSHPHLGAPHPGLGSPFALATHGHPHGHPLDHGLGAFPQGKFSRILY